MYPAWRKNSALIRSEINMNFKQKIAYMAIGCLFTLAGYFLATLGAGGFTPHNASAQADDEQVIDEIVCKVLKIVDDNNEIVAAVGDLGAFGSALVIRNSAGKSVAALGVDENDHGFLTIRQKAGNTFAAKLHETEDGEGMLAVSNKAGESIAALGVFDNDGGILVISNKAGEPIARIQANRDGDGGLLIYNKAGEPVIELGSTDDGGRLRILNKGKLKTY